MRYFATRESSGCVRTYGNCLPKPKYRYSTGSSFVKIFLNCATSALKLINFVIYVHHNPRVFFKRRGKYLPQWFFKGNSQEGWQTLIHIWCNMLDIIRHRILLVITDLSVLNFYQKQKCIRDIITSTMEPVLWDCISIQGIQLHSGKTKFPNVVAEKCSHNHCIYYLYWRDTLLFRERDMFSGSQNSGLPSI